MKTLTDLIFEAEDLYKGLSVANAQDHQLSTPSRDYPYWIFEIGNQSNMVRLGEIDADFATKKECLCPEDAVIDVINQMAPLPKKQGSPPSQANKGTYPLGPHPILSRRL